MNALQQDRVSILPEDKNGPLGNSALVWVITIMCFLAAITLGSVIAVDAAARSWTHSLVGSITIQIKPSKDFDQETAVKSSLNLLAKTAGVVTAKSVSDQKARELLEPWLGELDLLRDIPLPTLIEVTLDTGQAVDLANLEKELQTIAPGASLDDHRRWNDRLVRVAGAMKWLAFAILGLIIAATATIIVFATRAGMAANHELIEVLHLIGAKDNFIARQFEGHFLKLGLQAGLMGIGGAALTFLILAQAARNDWSGERSALLPTLSFDPAYYPYLLLVVFLAVVLSVATARFTVLSALKRIL